MYGIGARAELQRVRMRGKPDVDGQHPELLQERQDTRLGGQRQRDDQHVDARDAGEFDEFRDGAELRIAGDQRRRALVVAVVEDAADADVVVGLLLDRADQRLGGLASADDHRAALDGAVARPALDHPGKQEAQAQQQDEPGHEPGAEPQARKIARQFEEEANHRKQRQRPGPDDGDAAEIGDRPHQRGELVAVGDVEKDDRDQRGGGDDGRIMPREIRAEADIVDEEHRAGDDQKRQFDKAQHAADHDRGHGVAPVLRRHLARRGIELACVAPGVTTAFMLADRLHRKAARRLDFVHDMADPRVIGQQ